MPQIKSQLKNWREVKLGDVVDIIDGDRGKNYPKNFEFSDDGYCLFLNTKNVPDNRFSFTEKMFITEEKDKLLRKGRLNQGDYVLTTRGTVGNFAHYTKEIPYKCLRINSGMVILRVKNDLNENYFSFYLDSPLFKNQVLSRISGSAQPQLPIRDLTTFEVVLPSINTQKQIANVLSTYDNLIENNTKRIKILEEMAQAIYKEWFVSSMNGDKLPKGWKILQVEALVKRVSPGKLYDNKSALEKGGVPILDQGKSGIIGYHNDNPGVEASIENPIIVFANHTCYQRLILFPFSAIQNVLPFYPSEENHRNIFWLHYATKDLIEFNDYKGHWPEFMQKEVVVPPAEFAEKFGSEIKPLVVLSYQLELENRNLRESRDLLLPKLINGEIRV